MSSGTTAVTESEILSRAIETIDRAQWSRVAHVLSELKLPDGDLDRADELLEKNRTGRISDAERAELEKYLRVSNFLDLMRARALRERGESSAA
jgi:hypothetical protein